MHRGLLYVNLTRYVINVNVFEVNHESVRNAIGIFITGIHLPSQTVINEGRNYFLFFLFFFFFSYVYHVCAQFQAIVWKKKVTVSICFLFQLPAVHCQH